MSSKNEGSVKTTISVSRALFERIQKVKDSKLSISRVCQEGLEMAVRKREVVLKVFDELSALVERLRIEKEQAEKADKENGFMDGLKSAIKFSYIDFKAFERIATMAKRFEQGPKIPEIVDSALNDMNRDFTELFWDDDLEPVHTDLESYMEGYIEGVMDLWGKVSVQL
jgi:argininosuccinate lyase